MKYTIAISLLSATLTTALPTSNSTPSGYAVPSLLKIHDIKTNWNYASWSTSTVRQGNHETSTLYDIPIPASAAGRTCGLVFKATPSAGDDVRGTGTLDFFRNGFTDLASLTQGNLRDQLIARVAFDFNGSNDGVYNFVRGDVVPSVDSFPCPAGKTLHWEAAAVGEFDVNVVRQDFSYDGVHVPNGLSVAWW